MLFSRIRSLTGVLLLPGIVLSIGCSDRTTETNSLQTRNQMSVFESQEGDWVGETVYKKTDYSPERVVAEVSFIQILELDNTVFSVRGVSRMPGGDREYTWRITYDAAIGKYKAVYSVSGVVYMEYHGVYDEEANVIEWESAQKAQGDRAHFSMRMASESLIVEGASYDLSGRKMSDYRGEYRKLAPDDGPDGK